jgi:hypothetical protein
MPDRSILWKQCFGIPRAEEGQANGIASLDKSL